MAATPTRRKKHHNAAILAGHNAYNFSDIASVADLPSQASVQNRPSFINSRFLQANVDHVGLFISMPGRGYSCEVIRDDMETSGIHGSCQLNHMILSSSKFSQWELPCSCGSCRFPPSSYPPPPHPPPCFSNLSSTLLLSPPARVTDSAAECADSQFSAFWLLGLPIASSRPSSPPEAQISAPQSTFSPLRSSDSHLARLHISIYYQRNCMASDSPSS